MKTLLATLLVSSLAFADPLPGSGFTVPEDTPTLAPDVPEVSVRLRAGETAPFDGRLLSLEENLRRGKSAVECKGELDEAKTNLWMSKPLVIGLIVGGLVLGAAAGAAAVWAVKK